MLLRKLPVGGGHIWLVWRETPQVHGTTVVLPDGLSGCGLRVAGPTFSVSLSGAEKFRGRGKCTADLNHNLLYRDWIDMKSLRKRRLVAIMDCRAQCN